ncbi:Microtubule-associated protein, MAP65/ASE1-type [Niveomyces insectorum RCEF 264]|uniref:Microtubule-associated protein, MAP65/ASE1-type n=1 Tax=Niveomyces insectorum RCEF 264 TaxID=1081102 RepID=A0A162JCV5_9HYPO|nr:Microtubule-associated protein, MAP65/ASE1-type [Niveomyces insectorum RCEF 264]
MDASYLSQQVNGIIDQLHGLFDEIGVSNHERETREEELFNALSEALHNQVRLVTAEKKSLVDEAQRTITAIRQMETSLDDSRSRRDYEGDEDLQVTYPLSRCLQVLKEKHAQISKIHRERFEQVRKLVEALESYSSHLESTFVRIQLPPTGPNQSIPLNFDLSPAYVDKLDAEFTRVYEEYTRRVATVKALSEHIIQLWAELGTPQAQTDAAIVKHYRDAPEQLGLHEDDLARLHAKREKLADEKKAREKRLKDLKAAVEDLWGKLGVEEHEKKAFLNGNRGCGMRQINEFEDELARLNEQKRQHLPAFVEDARCKLQQLWDVLYLSEDEMLEFTPAFSDVYSDALLEAHEREIARLEALREQRAPTLALVDRHQTLVRERDELAASSQDASRLMMRGQKGEKRDPGKLLREEKTRKRIAKELPKVTVELRKVLEAWEDEYGRPFLVHGERYLDTIYDDSRSTAHNHAAAANPGPRSKTPAGPPPAAATSTAKSTVKRTVAPNGGGPARNAPSRAGARTPTASAAAASTVKRIPPAGTANGKMSPSRIPAATSTGTRAPLGALKHGANSPERRPRVDPRCGGGNTETNGRAGTTTAAAASAAAAAAGGGMLRSAPILMRAPPPKMRELVPAHALELETPVNPYQYRGTHLGSSVNVRHVEPEDVYDDRYDDRYDERYDDRSQDSKAPSLRPHSQHSQQSLQSLRSQQSMQSMQSQYSNHDFGQLRQHNQHTYSSQQQRYLQQQQQQQQQQQPQPQPQQPHSQTESVRHISATSTTVSGSENWETYDDNSEPEPDASETYYAKMRAARGKRATPDGGLGRPPSAMAKRVRGLPPPASAAYAGHVTTDSEGNRIVSGSEWTDEDVF